jgi:hypothetical protein
VRKRHILAIGLGLFLVWFSINFMFPRLHNDISCEDVVPSNAGESAALIDARSRKASFCSDSNVRCHFWLVHEDGYIRVSAGLVRKDFFEGCVIEREDYEILVYSGAGRFLRVEEAPFGLE